jgi:uncharacterized membrane protein YhaH (DUF805 family)
LQLTPSFWNLRDAMSYFDLLFSPKGTIKPQPFAIIVIAIYGINILAGSVLEGQFIKRVGPWPYLTLQALLTWLWFAAHAKRLRDAGRGYIVAATLAFIYIAMIVLMINIAAGSAASITENPKEASPSLFAVIFAVLFINTLFTGDIFLIGLLLFLFLGLPLLFSASVVIYSIVTGARTSLTPEPVPQPKISAFKP